MLGNSNVFSAQKQVISKKNKKKVLTEIEAYFSAKVGNSNVFSAQKQVISKKIKKMVFTEIEANFSAKIGYSNVFAGRITTCTLQLWHPISYGGAVFNFSPKNGLKSTKNEQFCILHKAMGGSSLRRPPPLTTLLRTVCSFYQLGIVVLKRKSKPNSVQQNVSMQWPNIGIVLS